MVRHPRRIAGREVSRCDCEACSELRSDDREQLLTDALDFIADNEWAAYGDGFGACLDCGAPRDSQHSENCLWLAIMRRGGRKT